MNQICYCIFIHFCIIIGVLIGYTVLTQKEPKMVRYNIEEKEYTWKKKRRRSADTGKSKDRRQKVVDGIIIQDYERRLESDAPHDGDEKRCGKDRREEKDRRK